jgi:hypothetical protein
LQKSQEFGIRKEEEEIIACDSWQAAAAVVAEVGQENITGC